MRFSNFDYQMFKAAQKQATMSDFKTFKIGCVIVYKKHIIGCGYNQCKTNPVQKKYNRKYRKFVKSDKPIVDSVHAEIAGLNSISYPVGQNINWSKVSVYIVRISPGRESGLGLARPCPACFAALRDKGIKNIYYSTNENGYAYESIN